MAKRSLFKDQKSLSTKSRKLSPSEHKHKLTSIVYEYYKDLAHTQMAKIHKLKTLHPEIDFDSIQVTEEEIAHAFDHLNGTDEEE